MGKPFWVTTFMIEDILISSAYIYICVFNYIQIWRCKSKMHIVVYVVLNGFRENCEK